GNAVAGTYGSVTINSNGSYTYTLNNSDPDTQALAQGASASEAFTYTVTDQFGATASTTLTITITGSNDGPDITVGAGDSTAETLVETDAALAVGGTLTVTDIDLSDAVTPTVASVVASGTTAGLGSNNAALAAMLTVTPASIDADSGDANNLIWSFSSTPEAFDYLDDGETLTLTYTVRATDDSLAFDEQTVTITITGSNDGPDITVGAGDSAAETLLETNAALAVAGTLTVTDIDLSDAVTPTVASVVASGTILGLGSNNAALAAMLTVTPAAIAADSGDANNLNWSFSSTPEAFDYLDDGETLTLTYTVRATDDSLAFDEQTLIITITGSNDGPDITVGSGDSAAETLAETNAALAVAGTLTVNDIDLSDAVTPTVASVVASGTTTGLGSGNAALAAMLTVTPASIDADPGAASNLNWSFSSTPEAFDYLDDGETLTLTYTVRATDDSLAFDEQTVIITITGSNDGPDITVGSGDSAAETLAETNAALAVGGTLTVTDIDLSDAVTPTVASVVASGTILGLGSNNAALAAMLTVTPDSIDADSGDTSNLNWSFSSTPEAFDYLDDGETLTLTYTVRATDDSLAFDEQTVTITITGSNDGPDITVGAGDSAAETLVETNAALAVGGTLTVTDIDLSDAVTPTVASVVASGTTTGLGSGNAALAAMLTVTPASIDADPGDTSNLNWSFSSTPEAFDYLDDGETLTLTYTVRATDDSPAFDEQTLIITITGSNDGPDITVGSGDSAAETLVETDAALAVAGTLTVNDIDLSDAVTPTVASVVASGTTTGLGSGNAALAAMLTVTPAAIDADPGDTSNLNWSFSSTPEAFDYLDDGETLTLTYTVRATDDSLAFDEQTVIITITGSNDGPDITVGSGDSAAETLVETNAALAVGGTLTVTDIDLSDTVTPTVASVVASGTILGLGSNNAALAAMLTVTPAAIDADPGDASNLNWSFSSTPEAFDYLDDGETLTLTYTVRATDDSLAFDEQTVTVTITGSNDGPDITVGSGDSAAETLVETDAALAVAGTLTVTDLDLSDAVTPTVTAVVASGTILGLGSNNAALAAMLTVTPA
ncbi:VCBS domain-containing protein, partial [Bradyrhizobium sp. AUGA SZCCT0222]|uniref:beta strand repeat-containing protein n=1 Tax=Bradyrhizobium sp. AUGA SZCCT0222 TaxID=2807668 RepID=UPI001BAA5FC9